MLGSQEQHGLHLPLATDSIIGAAIGEGVAQALGDALFAGLIPIGCSSEHRGFAGLLSLREETLAAIILDCLRTISQQGFKRAAIISAHGGNFNALTLLEKLLVTENLPLAIFVERPGTAGIAHPDISPHEAGLHAGEVETSLLLHLCPTLVKMELAEVGNTSDFAEIMQQLVIQGKPVSALSANGVLGDPRRASAERGKFYLHTAITQYTTAIRQFFTKKALEVHREI